MNMQLICKIWWRICGWFISQRTAQQAKDRSQMKRGQAASKLASDITRFFAKKWDALAVTIIKTHSEKQRAIALETGCLRVACHRRYIHTSAVFENCYFCEHELVDRMAVFKSLVSALVKAFETILSDV